MIPEASRLSAIHQSVVNYGYKKKFIKNLTVLGVTQKIQNQHLTHIQQMIPNKIKSKMSYGLAQTEHKACQKKNSTTSEH